MADLDHFSEIEMQAMKLSSSDRAKLATLLLHSLPSPGFDHDDDGVAEALRRDAEIDSDPSACLTLEEFKRAVER